MASVKQLSRELEASRRAATLELSRFSLLWQSSPGEMARTATLVGGSFGAGLLVGGAGNAPMGSLWQLIISEAPSLLHKLFESPAPSALDSSNP